MHTAQRLFRQRGFQATSVREIAAAIGLKPGSLYTHIESKEELLWIIASRAADRFLGMLQPIVESDRVVLEKLREAIRGHVRVVTDDLDAVAVYTAEWRHLSPQRRAQFVARRDEYESLMTRVVQDGIEQGYFNAADARLATVMILSSLNWVYQWYRPDGRMSPDEIALLMTSFILDGLKRRAG